MNSSYMYTGNPITPRFTLNLGNRLLNSETDFDVTITDNVNVGTAHVTIKGKGKFTGTINRTFEINPVPARSLSFFADNTEFAYTGKPCVMQIAVKFGDITLEEGRDYTVEYIDNVAPGKANAKLTFMGNYQGVMTVPFEIYEPEETFDEAPFDENEEYEELKNLSTISSENITLGDKIVVTSEAEGGKPYYTFAVLYKRTKGKKWVTVQDYGVKSKAVIKPQGSAEYTVCVKARDRRKNVAKKYFTVNVAPNEE